MLQLEEIKNKEELFRAFFEWLFDDSRISKPSINLSKEIDLSLCPYYYDAYIYYPEQIKAFFDTPAMKRLGKISQLDLTINDYPNAYHNRLEHSKGVYNRKLEEFVYNFQNPDWKKHIEDNNLKLYLIAELIKMAGHDIGHPPLSHAIERETIGKAGLHEEIGQRIILENPEIQQTLLSISPELPQALANLYNTSVLNFKEHDESNYDVDRLDYLNRDNFYFGTRIHLPLQQYQTICVEKDENGIPKTNPDFSISETKSGNGYIDVYDFSSLPEIEKTLLTRLSGYSNAYMSSKVASIEKSIPILFKNLLNSNSKVGENLKNYLLHLSNASVENIDLSEYISWDETKFYSELLDIAEHHEDPNIRTMATMLIPQMDAFLKLMYSHLNIHDRKSSSKNFSQEELELLKKIKKLIKSDSELAQHLRDPNYAINNIIFVPNGTVILSNSGNQLTQSCVSKVSAYKKSEPIYIRDESGKVFELSHHPNRHCNWDKKEIIDSYTFLVIPDLKLNGFSDDEISSYQKLLPAGNPPPIQRTKNISINMQPLQVGHNIEDEFEI